MECPNCGGDMWDNRENKKNPKAPDYKCKDKTCIDPESGMVTAVWLPKKPHGEGTFQGTKPVAHTPPAPLAVHKNGDDSMYRCNAMNNAVALEVEAMKLGSNYDYSRLETFFDNILLVLKK